MKNESTMKKEFSEFVGSQAEKGIDFKTEINNFFFLFFKFFCEIYMINSLEIRSRKNILKVVHLHIIFN